MNLIRCAVFCSTPNFRGIHQYSIYVNNLLRTFFESHLYCPTAKNHSYPNILAFLGQIIWEFSPPGFTKKPTINFYAYSRIPLHFLPKHESILGIVVHDFIQYIPEVNFSSILLLYRNYGLLELLKRLFHTIYFDFSAKRSSFLMFNSEFTQSQYSDLFSGTQSFRPSLILHPAPSFEPEKVHSVSRSIPLDLPDQPGSVSIHVVSGFAPSKQSSLLEECLLSLSKLFSNSSTLLTVNVFGFSSKFLRSLNCNKFRVNCFSGFVEDRVLIASSLESSIYFSTSSEEGFGIPLLDSILFGLTCVCTPLSPYLEIDRVYSPSPSKVSFSAHSDFRAKSQLVQFLAEEIVKSRPIKPHLKAKSYCDASSKIKFNASLRLKAFLESVYS